MGQGVNDMSISSGAPGRPQSAGLRNDRDGPPTPPPKDGRGNYIDPATDRGGYGNQEYSQIGGHGDMMPPRHPYAPPGPSQGMPKTRPNYTKLGPLYYHTLYVYAN